MKNYLKLLNFEVNRFFKLYLTLIGLIIVSQFIGAIVVSKVCMNDADRVMFKNQLSMSQYIKEYGVFSFHYFIESGWFLMPIFFSIAMLMIYVFFIWYRDWFGKNTFIYRLLMLPTERITIYFAKLTTIMLLVLGLVTLQILLIPIEIQIFNSIIPTDLQSHFSFYNIYSLRMWRWLYPKTFTEFILIYGVGLISVAVLFTAILIERSYGLKGIYFAIVYGMLSFGVLLVPILVNEFDSGYFYALEVFLMELVMSIIVLSSAIWIANHLLKNKIRV
ncbi:ABC transporter permease [Lysinibacillus sp. CTST325]